MEFQDYFNDAKNKIIIIGTNSLFPYLERSAKYFYDKMILEDNLHLSIYYESNSENFNQSLSVDTPVSINRTSFTTLQTHRDRIVGTTSNTGLKNEILDRIEKEEIKKKINNRISLYQINLRLPINLIQVDNKIWFCFVTNKLPKVNEYHAVNDEKLKKDLIEYIKHYTISNHGQIYLSKRGDELIQLYDRDSIPRGIYPRKAFYTTEFKRYSIWGFVFNRKGELLLHQRSKKTKDNKLLWDKSIGGHVDIVDSSTYQTAQRELVEELFLPQAEFTPYLKEDIGDFNNYGDLNFQKRPESEFKEAFQRLKPTDWIMFRATDRNGIPLCVSRISERKITNDKTGKIITRKTVFMSDVYLFISPPNYMDTHKQMKDLVKLAEKSGAAEDHKLVSVDKLREWIEKEEQANKAHEVFTDDLLYINLELRSLIERFSEFINYIF